MQYYDTVYRCNLKRGGGVNGNLCYRCNVKRRGVNGDLFLLHKSYKVLCVIDTDFISESFPKNAYEKCINNYSSPETRVFYSRGASACKHESLVY